MKKFFIALAFMTSQASFATTDEFLANCSDMVVNALSNAFQLTNHPTPLGRVFLSNNMYNEKVLDTDFFARESLSLARRNGKPRRVMLTQNRSYFTSSGNLVKFKAGTEVEFEPNSYLVVDDNAYFLSQMMGNYFSADNGDVIDHVSSWLRGEKRPKSTVDLTKSLSEHSLDRVDELRITVRRELDPDVRIPMDLKTRNADKTVTFNTLPAAWRVDDGGNLVMIRQDDGYRRTIMSSSIVKIEGLRYQDVNREELEKMTGAILLQDMKEGDRIMFHLSRRVFSEDKYNDVRGLLLDNQFPRGQIVKVLRDRIIIARENRSLVVIPKDAIIYAAKYELKEEKFSAEERAAEGYKNFRKWDDDSATLQGGDTVGQNMFFFDKGSGIGPSWIFIPGPGGHTVKYGGWLRIKALGIDIPMENVTRANREWKPSTRDTVWNMTTPDKNDHVSYRPR